MTESYSDLENGLGEVSRLKSLLFRNEQLAIDEIKEQLAEHDDRIGSDADMQRSVATVLAGALHDARVERHREVSDAIAPILVEGMKREIKNSRDEMVDALYPIMGRLVSAYVTSAVSEMMEQTNARLESGLSGRFLYLRAKSVVTGTAYADLVMAETRRFRISELMLIRRGSGLLVDHLNLDVDDGAAANALECGAAGGKDRDSNSALVSGVVAAIHEFAQDAFKGRRNSLRSVDMGDQTIYLRATPGLIFAVIGRGNASRKLEKALDAELLTLLEDHSDDIAQLESADAQSAPKIFPMVAERLLAVQREKGNKKPVLAVFLLGLLGAAVAGYAAWSAWEATRMAQLRASVWQTIEGQPAFSGYPVQVDITPDRTRVRVSGFAPSAAARDALVAKLDGNVQGAELASKFTVIAPADDLEKRITVAERRLDTEIVPVDLTGVSNRINTLDSETKTVRRSLDERTETLAATTEKRAVALQERLDAIELELNNPLNRLRSWNARNAVFFGDGTVYRDGAKARGQLRRLSDLVKAADVRIRVVGYADIRGTPESNQVLAKNRADQVRNDLARAGVPSNRIIAVGRAAERQLSTLLGPESGNRRVEFEVMLDGE